MRRLSIVVLPEPLGPMIAIFWPAGMSRSTSRRTWTSRNAFDTDRNRTIGADVESALDSGFDAGSTADGGSGLGSKATLQSLDEDRGRIAQEQEDEPDDRQRLEIPVRPARFAQSRPEELVDRDGGEQRRVLEHRDQVVAQRGDDRWDRLGKDDPRPRSDWREVEGDCGFPLPGRDAADAGPVDLRGVRAVVQAEREDPGHQWARRDTVAW